MERFDPEMIKRKLMGDRKIEAIATKFDGVQFRSRLEAKWAAFFNLKEWKWEYEPFDCNGWIPDFLLLDPWQMLVEVKPYTCFEDFEKNGVVEKIRRAVEGTEHNEICILLLGCVIGKPLFPSPLVLGWELSHDSFLGDNIDTILWKDAGNAVQWRKEKKEEKQGIELFY